MGAGVSFKAITVEQYALSKLTQLNDLDLVYLLKLADYTYTRLSPMVKPEKCISFEANTTEPSTCLGGKQPDRAWNYLYL